jgi:C-terminal processing protease CtpA/Prc
MTGVIFLYGADNSVLDQPTRLAGLCKVWGLLKYYHPDVATGEIDWDAVLADAIPAVKAAADYQSFNREIGNLIQQAGGVEKLDYNPDAPSHPNEELFKWIKDSTIFSSNVSKQLKIVQKKHVPANNYYVQYGSLGVPSFKNEKAYEQLDYPDENFRLVSLFRYWNIVNYFFPYKDLIDESWDGVLEEFIPQFIAAGDVCQYQRALRLLFVHTNDGHSVGIYPDHSPCYPTRNYAPFEVSYIENQTVITRIFPGLLDYPGQAKVGDIILKYDGLDIDVYRKEQAAVTPAANEACQWKFVNRAVHTGAGDALTYTISKNGQVEDIGVTLHPSALIRDYKYYYNLTQPKWRILSDNTGYVDMALLSIADAGEAMAELMNTDGIIFDLRFGNKGAVYRIARYLFPGTTVFAKLTWPNRSYPGAFDMFSFPVWVPENDNYYKGKTAILVNENSISSMEFSAMALQAAPNAVVIGSQTAGSDGNVTPIVLPGGVNIYMSGLGVYYPDGTPAQRLGISIDIEARPTAAGVQAGRDEVLEKAVQFIESGK